MIAPPDDAPHVVTSEGCLPGWVRDSWSYLCIPATSEVPMGVAEQDPAKVAQLAPALGAREYTTLGVVGAIAGIAIGLIGAFR